MVTLQVDLKQNRHKNVRFVESRNCCVHAFVQRYFWPYFGFGLNNVRKMQINEQNIAVFFSEVKQNKSIVFKLSGPHFFLLVLATMVIIISIFFSVCGGILNEDESIFGDFHCTRLQ